MKITRVRAWHPASPGAPKDWRSTLGQILAVVETDSGVRGIGVGGGGPAGIHVIDAVLGPLLIGETVDDIPDLERLWERLYRATLPYGRKGLAIMAISALDLALWDAAARERGVSVCGLLGGPAGARVPCYITGGKPEEAVARGFTAVKLSCGTMTPDDAVARVAVARDQIGPDVRLMTDAAMRWDVEGSLRAAEGFARYGVEWLEEPLPPDDLAGYAELVRRSPVPIAGGEHEFTIHGFRELAAHRAHAIWQPDVTWTGGLTQLRAIFALGLELGIPVVPHRGAEVWALHAIAALSPQPLAESGRPWLTWLHGEPQPSRGYVVVPDGPGFGVEATVDPPIDAG